MPRWGSDNYISHTCCHLPAGGPLIADVNTFDRHLLREWLQILGLVLAATCGLLLLQVLYDDFRGLRELRDQLQQEVSEFQRVMQAINRVVEPA